jgi:hypothetical protein
MRKGRVPAKVNRLKPFSEARAAFVKVTIYYFRLRMKGQKGIAKVRGVRNASGVRIGA